MRHLTWTYPIIKTVDTLLLCLSQISAYFISTHEAFSTYLHKMENAKVINSKDGNIGDIKHYLFGKCSMMPISFKFIRSRALRWKMRNKFFSKSNYNKFRAIYKGLNKHVPFVKYKFWFLWCVHLRLHKNNTSDNKIFLVWLHYP